MDNNPNFKEIINNKEALGMHLTIDAADCDLQKLNDFPTLFAFLRELPAKVDMTRVTEPYIVKYDANTEKDSGGYSGFVILAESHTSFHTYPERKFIGVDLFSCKYFEVENVIKAVKETFKTENIKSQTIIRGENFPF